jgi:hypothetical protein
MLLRGKKKSGSESGVIEKLLETVEDPRDNRELWLDSMEQIINCLVKSYAYIQNKNGE